MEVRIHTRNAAIDEEVRSLVIEKLGHAARVYEQGVADIDVEVSEEHNPRLAAERFRIEVTTKAAGHLIRVVAAAASPEAAVDGVVDRFNQQLRRLKERLIGRNRRPAHRSDEDLGAGTDASNEIVRIKQFVMKPMTVQEAVLQMEMLGHDFFFFFNSASDRHSVLYRRRDGRLGLIEQA
ncbi:MAG: ribosome hibernation-promoting factor, HPF/YfiA family [Acidimicrobiia bacterium]